MEKYIFNECVYLGANARTCLKDELKKRKLKKVLLVSDDNIIKSGVLLKVSNVLDEAKIKYSIYSDIKPNPTVENVQNGVMALKKSKASVIIAVGGGSVIDTAKGMAIIATNKKYADVVSLNGAVNTPNKAFPLIALPTTAGTAAEATINYVITDTKIQRKMVCVDPHDIPMMAIVDAELMVTMPKGLTASTGMDALTHAIESLVTKGATQFSDMFALEAIRTIAEWLPKAYKNSEDIVAREKMAYAQYVVGMGFSNVGLGLVHSMAHPLGGRFDIGHGVANAMLLPTVMQYNAESDAKLKYRKIAECFGYKTEKLSDDKCVALAINAVKKLADKLDIPKSLKELGIKQKDLDVLSQDAFADICTGGNPRETSVKDIKSLYKSLL
ncbi:MAG: iron-containing alcohol dehydrogenase [Clostridiales bacterium]|nr:iron-containing alcohol dehydrogenase [Clostridiales bacterium]